MKGCRRKASSPSSLPPPPLSPLPASVPREGSALLQGMVYCGVCGRKMSVQNRSVKESRSPSYICARGYQNGEEKICQEYDFFRPIDAAVVEAFLAAILPGKGPSATQVMDQIEQELVSPAPATGVATGTSTLRGPAGPAAVRCRRSFNRLVAAELERRWNEKLERVTELERTYAQAERDAEWKLTAEERAAITELSWDLPAIWGAETTTNQERKQLLRMVIESVQLDGISQAGQIEVQIHWRPARSRA